LEKNPIYINGLYWPVTITTKHLTIGCQHHTHEEWENFSEQEIKNMDNNAPTFWKVWKTHLLAMCKAHKE
jgi:hypothetical protein